MDSLASVSDFENHARETLSKNSYNFFRSGAGDEDTLINNRSAFSKLKIRPRCLRNVSKRDLSTTILGERIEMPIGIAPTALQRMAHPDGERATAKGAQAMGTIFALSTASSYTIEDVAEAAPRGTKWFQMFIYKDRNLTEELVRTAEKAGFKALLLTIDCPVLGSRKFVLPPDIKFANFVGKKVDVDYFKNIMDPALQWKDLKWLQGITKLPIVLKGILTAQDAIIAANLGFPAILVSNHGGRQLDGCTTTIDALPEIVEAVGDKMEVYVDGGVADGVHVYKALALGARMVFVGRAPVWGLVHSGEEGVKKVMEILRTELDYAMAISGCSSIKEISREMVASVDYFSKL